MFTNPSTFRRRLGAASIVAFFLVLLAGGIIAPTDSHKNADQLAAAATHPARVQAMAWLAIVASMLAPVVVLTLVHLVRRRGVVLAHLGAIVGIVGSIGMAAIGVHALFVIAIAQRGGSSGVAVLDRLNHLAPAMLVLFFLLPLALVLLAGAAARAGLAGRWVVAGAIAFLVADQLPLPGVEVVQQLIGLAVFGSLARRILRLSDSEWERPELAATARRPRTTDAPAPA